MCVALASVRVSQCVYTSIMRTHTQPHAHICIHTDAHWPAQVLRWPNEQTTLDSSVEAERARLEAEDDPVNEFEDEDEDEQDAPSNPSSVEATPILDKQPELAAEDAQLKGYLQGLEVLSGAERKDRFDAVEAKLRTLVTGYGEHFTSFSVPADHWANLRAKEEAGTPIIVLSGSFLSRISKMGEHIRATNPDGTLKSPVWAFAKAAITEPAFDELILMNANPASDDHDNGKAAWTKFSPADFARIARWQAVALKVRAVAASRRASPSGRVSWDRSFAAAGGDPPRLVRRQGQEALRRARLLCSLRPPCRCRAPLARHTPQAHADVGSNRGNRRPLRVGRWAGGRCAVDR